MLRVGIQLDLIGGYGREVLRGLMQYANLAGNWEFIMPQMYAPERKKWFSSAETNGVVSMVHDPRSIEPLHRSGIPVVNVAHTLDLRRLVEAKLPSVLPDDERIGTMAYEYFREKGFRSFAFCGHPVAGWSRRREAGFAGSARADGFPCACVEIADTVPREWLTSLSRPVALLAANDRYGWHAIDACRELQIRVPEDIAILGVDNDVLVADLVRPMLSSVKPSAFQVGIEAGRMLGALMDGKPAPAEPLLIPPEGVITRHSTEVLMLNDDAVVSAVRFIRLNAGQPISVADVVDEVMVSRRNLERRFRAALGRSLLQELRRVRIHRACELLRDTDFEMPVIAESCGFMSHVRFSTVFRQLTGMAPSTYRKRNRASK